MSTKRSPLLDEVLEKLRQRKTLDEAQMSILMEQIVAGNVADETIEDVLLILRERGETAVEIASAAKVLREHALKLPKKFPDLLDTCGTGGDGQRTLNVSTLSALVASAAGARVAKHGNRAVSSLCGSADLLEMLGVKIDLAPESLATCLEATGFAFFFAPRYHPAVKAAMPARKRIQGKTIFNILGPLANPAEAPYQIVGVYEERLVPVVASALVKLGTKRALVVHGKDGMDEISLSAETVIAEVKNGMVTDSVVVPEDFSLKREPLINFRCQTIEDYKAAAMRVLQADPSAATKIVCLNAAAALYISGRVASIKEGLLLAMDAVESGKVSRKVKKIAEITQKLS